MVMSTTIRLLRAWGSRAVTPRSSTSHRTSGSEKLSAAKAEDKNPARVMAIWMAERKLSGAWVSLRSFLSPSSACLRSLASDREITEISAAAKKALMRIRTASRISLGKNGSSDKIDDLLFDVRSVEFAAPFYAAQTPIDHSIADFYEKARAAPSGGPCNGAV